MLFEDKTLVATLRHNTLGNKEEAMEKEDAWETYRNQFPRSILVEVQNFVDSLMRFSGPMVFNPWYDYHADYDVSPEAPKWRRRNLLAYLLPRLGRAHHLIVAEAAGYQGGHFTGIAITCERMLLNLHPTVGAEVISPLPLWRTSNPYSEVIPKGAQREKGFIEPTDTVVWGAILENQIDPYDTLLWNIFPFHPHKSKDLLTNRTPKSEELEIGWQYMDDLLAAHKRCALMYESEGRAGASSLPLPACLDNPVLAVGRKCAQVLELHRIPAVALRHPANGGAMEYRRNFQAALEELS